MKRKIVAILLMAAVGLAGCGGQTGVGGGNTEAPAAVQEAATTEDGEVDIWSPYQDTVTLSTVKTENSGTTYPEGDDISDNVWIRAYKDKFNVEVVTDWVSDE